MNRLADITVGDCRCVSLSPDGSALFTVVGELAELREPPGPALWTAHVSAPAELPVEALWTPDGEQIVLLAGGRLRLLGADSGTPRALPTELQAAREVTAIAVSGDGMRLAAGTGQGTILHLDRGTGRIGSLRRTGDRVTALAWHPSGAELCVARPRAIQFWHLATGTMISSITATDVHPRRLCWSPEGSLIAVAGLRDVRTVDTTLRREISTPFRVTGEPVGLGFSRDGSRVLVGLPSPGGVELLDRQLVPPGDAPVRMPAELAEPAQLHISATGMVAVRGSAETVSLWRLPDTITPDPRATSTAALRRWAARTARTLGRAPRDEGEAPPVPSFLAEPDTGRWAPGFAWAPAGRSWFTESPTGSLTRSRGRGTPALWSRPVPSPPGGLHGIEVLGDRYLALSARDPHNLITVLDAADGHEVTHLPGGQDPAWAPDRPVLAVPAPVRGDGPPTELLVHELRGGRPRRLVVREGTGSPDWSLDGRLLAAPSLNAVIVWDGSTLERVQRLRLGDDRRIRLDRVAWSPDGAKLAAAPADGRSPVIVWETARWTATRTLGPAGPSISRSLAWSPDSRLLAFPRLTDRRRIDVWEVESGRPLLTLPPPDDDCRYAWVVRWTPDGDGLVVTYGDGSVVRWAIPSLPPGPDTGRLPYPVDLLTRLGAGAVAAGVAQPLALLTDLLSLLHGRAPARLGEFEGHRRVAALRALRWPLPATMGLALLVAADMPPVEPYRSPDGVTTEEAAAELHHTLYGTPVAPAETEPPVPELTAALDRIDDETLTVATLVGPDAAAAEPDLLARIRRLHFGHWQLTPRQRRLLGVRAVLRTGGITQGRGLGDTRAGISRHGDPTALLPSQLVMDEDLLAAKQTRDELLYRTRQGTLPTGAYPMVIVLDDTPPAHGLVGTTLRVAAHLLTAYLVGRHRRCALILLGSPERVRYVAAPTDLVRLWSAGSADPPAPETARRLVDSAAARLSDPLGGPAGVVVFTHPYLPWSGRPGEHIVRVHYPGRPVEATAPRTHVLAPDGNPEQIYEVIAAVLADRR